MEGCQGKIPGPNYKLPTLTGYDGHDYSKNRAPAFSVGVPNRELTVHPTPGPYKIGSVDRRGRYPYQGWTIESTARYQPKPIDPSPLSYAPEKVKMYTPAFSLGLKAPDTPVPFGPSPAEYFPQYSNQGGITIGTAWKSLPGPESPGPQAPTVTNLYKPRAPAYSLGLKGKTSDESPGPGPRYHPEKAGFKNAPGYSFGMKHGRCAPPMITYEDGNND